MLEGYKFYITIGKDRLGWRPRIKATLSFAKARDHDWRAKV
jgi:hypothetical protein